MLKHKLTAAEHAALADGLKASYVADGTEFRLDVVEDPRVKELQTSVGEFRENNVALLKRLDVLEKAGIGDQDPPIRKTGDQLKIAKLEEKMVKLTAENTKSRSVASAATFKTDVAQIATGGRCSGHRDRGCCRAFTGGRVESRGGRDHVLRGGWQSGDVDCGPLAAHDLVRVGQESAP